jgi:hypothetical protein
LSGWAKLGVGPIGLDWLAVALGNTGGVIAFLVKSSVEVGGTLSITASSKIAPPTLSVLDSTGI